ncbi:MAG: TIGR02679 family protein [Acidimicrobiia bacterium]
MALPPKVPNAARAVDRDQDRVARTLDRPELAPLWDELFRRYGEGVGRPASITLRQLSPPERQALADLLGSDRLVPVATRIRTDRLAAAIGTDPDVGLRELVVRLRGPIRDRQAERATTRHAREELWAWLTAAAGELPLFAAAPAAVQEWRDAVQAGGVPGGSVDRHRLLLERAVSVLRAIPADAVALPSLAQDRLGDPHGLDRGRKIASLAIDALAIARGQDPPTDAEGIRSLWEVHGVIPDPYSSTVLVVGLRPAGEGPLVRWTAEAAAAGEPVSLTLAQLRRWPLPPLPAGSVAYVVENPSLISEAAATGWSGPTLVCSSGRPSLAVVLLLRQLAAAGARLAQHADFDVAGIGITAWLTERAGTTPWRMRAQDYLAAAGQSGSRRPLTGRVPITDWDLDLARAMTQTGVAVYEEELRNDLIARMAAGER